MYNVKVITKYSSTYPTHTQVVGDNVSLSEAHRIVESFGRSGGFLNGCSYRIGTDEYLHGGIVQRQYVQVDFAQEWYHD